MYTKKDEEDGRARERTEARMRIREFVEWASWYAHPLKTARLDLDAGAELRVSGSQPAFQGT